MAFGTREGGEGERVEHFGQGRRGMEGVEKVRVKVGVGVSLEARPARSLVG